jgi:hypothetical protein
MTRSASDFSDVRAAGSVDEAAKNALDAVEAVRLVAPVVRRRHDVVVD